MKKNNYKILIFALLSVVIMLSMDSVYAELPIDLGTSGNFAILSETTITDATPASSTITGNIGVHPQAGTFITDVSCSTVDGIIYDNNAGYTGGFDSDVTCLTTDATLLGIAIGHMQAAYGNASGRTAGVGEFLNVGTGTLTDQTLVPGVYTWGSAVSIPTDLTLDCENDANAVFVFQISGTLDIASAKQVLLINECQAKNIFWQVADAVTLGTTSVFEGNILAQTSIAIQNGATLNGRALASTAVTLDDNTITLPLSLALGNSSTDPITTTNALVLWTTDESANSSVNYGLDSNLGTIVSDVGLVTNHSILLENLSSSTMYFYNVTSCYAGSTCETSGIFNFTTMAVPEPEPEPTPTSTGSGGGSSSGRYTSTTVNKSADSDPVLIKAIIVEPVELTENTIEDTSSTGVGNAITGNVVATNPSAFLSVGKIMLIGVGVLAVTLLGYSLFFVKNTI